MQGVNSEYKFVHFFNQKKITKRNRHDPVFAEKELGAFPPVIPERLELVVPHVVDGEDEESVVLIDSLPDFVDQVLLEV
jgi:hypothetical protein